MKHLQSRGQDLRLLSLHGLDTDFLLQDNDLESIVRLCPNLQQLAHSGGGGVVDYPGMVCQSWKNRGKPCY
jgi:hypothetical protein